MKPISQMQGAIFDMDGTLIDSMKVWREIGSIYLQRKGLVPEADVWNSLKSLSLGQGAVYLKQAYGMKETPAQIEGQINALLEDLYRHEIPLKPYVAEYLSDLDRQGIPMCVATATDQKLAEVCLKRLQIHPYMKGILTCNMVNAGKQESPKVFEAAWELLGTKKEYTYVFEDALHALKTAHNAGFPTVAVHDTSCPKEDWEEMKRLADVWTMGLGPIE